jgi:hypothetical protein
MRSSVCADCMCVVCKGLSTRCLAVSFRHCQLAVSWCQTARRGQHTGWMQSLMRHDMSAQFTAIVHSRDLCSPHLWGQTR